MLLKEKTYSDYIRFKIAIIVLLAIITFFALVVSIASGSADLTVWQVIKALFGQGTEQTSMIVLRLRLPRAVTAAVGGIGLAIVGCVMQSVLRNPMASASTLGVSQGAAFGAAFAIVMLGAGSEIGGNATVNVANPYSISVCAFIGSMFSTIVIIGMSKIKAIKSESMILAGVALSTLFSGGTAIIQYFADQTQVASIVYWMFGNLGNTTWREIIIVSVVVAFALIFFIANRWNYIALLSGDNSAKGLGVNVDSIRLSSMLVCSLTAATITAFVGILNFIGLIAPHIVRKIIGNDYRFLLPASAFTGSILLLVSDTLSRMIVPPQILPIGAITSFIGAPFFLYLIFREGKSRW